MDIALPNSKRLLPPLLNLLKEKGWEVKVEGRDLRVKAPGGLDVRLIKPKSIPGLFELGCLDAGFTGLDVMVESRIPLQDFEVLDLGLNPVHLMVCTPISKEGILTKPQNRPYIVGTEYENISEDWMRRRGYAHVTLNTGGCTEAYLPDPCDVIIDVVETGDTLRANGLVGVEEVMKSTTCLWVRKDRMNRNLSNLINLLK
jgi:ATP phosphoribosyltransferase